MPIDYFPNGVEIQHAMVADSTMAKGVTFDGLGNWLWVQSPALPSAFVSATWGLAGEFTYLDLTSDRTLRVPRFTVATLPVPGIPGRIVFTTDDNSFRVDTGSAWAILQSTGGGSVTGGGVANQVAVWASATSIGGNVDLTHDGTKLHVGDPIENTANPSWDFAPVGNPASTFATLSVVGTTPAVDKRIFLGSFGLTSNQGVGHTGVNVDKVTLYSGLSAQSGTGDVWSVNSVLTQEAASGSYNAQGYELDFNNLNAHRGDTVGVGGLSAPIAYGLSITGVGSFRNTAALLISGPGTAIWNRGIVLANDCISSTGSSFQDFTGGFASIDIQGDPTYGIYQTFPSTLNKFAGGIIAGPVTSLPGVGNAGRILFNTTDSVLYVDNGTAWGSITVPVLTSGSVVFAGGAGQLTQDNAQFFWDDANNAIKIGSLGSGVATVPFQVSFGGGPSVPVARFETVDAVTTGTSSAGQFVHRTTVDMGANFGVYSEFIIRDNAGADNAIARLVASRATVDDTGLFAIQTPVGGSFATRLATLANGDINIAGGLSLLSIVTVGDIQVGGNLDVRVASYTGAVTTSAQIAAASGLLPAQLETVDAGTANILPALRLEHRSTADMGNGFGVAQDFVIRDTANIDNVITRFLSFRDATGDTTGLFSIQTPVAGSLASRFNILNNGDVNVPGGFSSQTVATVNDINAGNHLLVQSGTYTGSSTVAVQVSNPSDVLAAQFEVVGVSQTSQTAAIRSEHRTTHISGMSNGFGTGIDFVVRDNSNVDNVIGGVFAYRQGADNTGQLAFRTAIAGSVGDRVLIDENGSLLAGATAVTSMAVSGNTTVGGFAQVTEIADPGSGGANTARVYARDNGAGKTQLVVVFNTGAVQVLATEP